ERPEKSIMEESPRPVGQPLIERRALKILGLSGFYVGISTLMLFQFFLNQSYELARTVAFTNIVMTAQMLALNFRSLHGSLSSVGWFSNPWILAAIAAMTLMQAAAIYLPFLQGVLH